MRTALRATLLISGGLLLSGNTTPTPPDAGATPEMTCFSRDYSGVPSRESVAMIFDDEPGWWFDVAEGACRPSSSEWAHACRADSREDCPGFFISKAECHEVCSVADAQGCGR